MHANTRVELEVQDTTSTGPGARATPPPARLEEFGLTLVGLKVQGATQNTSPVLPERRIIFGTSCSMIEAALEREANLPPKLRRHAQFERVVCLATSAPTVCSEVEVSEKATEEVEHTFGGTEGARRSTELQATLI